ncbi:MAG TPA: response regulator transcription factor [Pyrinomonadaceae bacterium]|nr:response regulator transcription factor [Pyrinomonadaceae bacterium]
MFTFNKQTKRVLIADDDPVIRRLVASAVEREGYDVVEAKDGREAYRILQSDADFKAAIFDMMMPHLGGLDIIRFMRTEKRLIRIPVMMITSESDLKLMAESLAAGAVLFLPKPFTSEQLQATVSMLLLSKRNLTTKAA